MPLACSMVSRAAAEAATAASAAVRGSASSSGVVADEPVGPPADGVALVPLALADEHDPADLVADEDPVVDVERRAVLDRGGDGVLDELAVLLVLVLHDQVGRGLDLAR